MISNLAQSSSKCEGDTNQLASILENRDQKLGSQHAPPHGPSKPDIASITSFLGKGEKMVWRGGIKTKIRHGRHHNRIGDSVKIFFVPNGHKSHMNVNRKTLGPKFHMNMPCWLKPYYGQLCEKNRKRLGPHSIWICHLGSSHATGNFVKKIGKHLGNNRQQKPKSNPKSDRN